MAQLMVIFHQSLFVCWPGGLSSSHVIPATVESWEPPQLSTGWWSPKRKRPEDRWVGAKGGPTRSAGGILRDGWKNAEGKATYILYPPISGDFYHIKNRFQRGEWWWMMMNDDSWWLINDDWWWLMGLFKLIWLIFPMGNPPELGNPKS